MSRTAAECIADAVARQFEDDTGLWDAVHAAVIAALPVPPPDVLARVEGTITTVNRYGPKGDLITAGICEWPAAGDSDFGMQLELEAWPGATVGQRVVVTVTRGGDAT